MRILILANDYSAKVMYDYFCKDKENIVFSLCDNCNKVDFLSQDDIVEFVEANAINFILITDEKYIEDDLTDKFNKFDCCVFSPCQDAVEIIKSKSYAKKFMYKNKIPTTEFQVFEKAQVALDYIKNLNHPVAIKPEQHNFKERTYFCDTRQKCFQKINELFYNGNEKIVIEEYVEGKNITLWALTDGFSSKMLGICAKYQDEISYFEPEFIDENMKNVLIQDVVNPTINALSLQESEFVGVLGFDLILDKKGEFKLLGYKNFFDDLDIEFFLKAYDVDWLDVFNSTIRGDVFLKFDVEKRHDEYMLSFREGNSVNLLSAKTMSNLELYLKQENFDYSCFEEARKIWNS